MISLVKLIISGIHKIFFLLRSTVITVCHHQVPMYIFDNSVPCRSKRILALSNVADDTGISATLFLYFTKCRFFILFAKFHSPFRQNPSFVTISVILVQKQYLASVYHHTATTGCFYHCISSFVRLLFLRIVYYHSTINAMLTIISKGTPETSFLQSEPRIFRRFRHLPQQY